MQKKKRLVTALLLSLLLATTTTVWAKSKLPFNDYAAADAAIEQNYDAALESVDTFIAKHPKKADGYFWKGYLYKKVDDTELALENLEKSQAIKANWPALENLMEIYYQEDNKALLARTARSGVAFYKKHPKKVTTTPSSIALMYYLAGEYYDGLKLYPEITDDKNLDIIRAEFCRKIAETGKSNGDIYLARLYALRGLDYLPDDEGLLALEAELSDLIALDQATAASSYKGSDYRYRYYYWHYPIWYYGYWGYHWRHHPPLHSINRKPVVMHPGPVLPKAGPARPSGKAPHIPAAVKKPSGNSSPRTQRAPQNQQDQQQILMRSNFGGKAGGAARPSAGARPSSGRR